MLIKKIFVLAFFFSLGCQTVCADQSEVAVSIDFSPMIQKAQDLFQDAEVSAAATQLYNSYLTFIETILRKVAQQCGPQERAFAHTALMYLLEVVRDPIVRSELTSSSNEKLSQEKAEYMQAMLQPIVTVFDQFGPAIIKYIEDNFTVTKSETRVADEGLNKSTSLQLDYDNQHVRIGLFFFLERVTEILETAQKAVQ